MFFYALTSAGLLRVVQAPYQTLMELKVFYKGYLRQNKGYFIEILTKIKSKLTSKDH